MVPLNFLWDRFRNPIIRGPPAAELFRLAESCTMGKLSLEEPPSMTFQNDISLQHRKSQSDEGIMSCSVELISIGNELLIGKVLNTNAHWLSRIITTLGGRVKRMTTIGDNIEEIVSVVNEALARGPRFIITTGGLGPTFDDMTVDAISKALHLPVVLDEQALEMVRVRYLNYAARTGKTVELTPARLKMAKLPSGAKPLRNPVGTAPGILMEVYGTTLVILPGVPDEMRAIFEESVMPMIREAAGNRFVYDQSLAVTGTVEAEIAPLIDRVMGDNPFVYIKSHPKRHSSGVWLELHLMTTSDSAEEARTVVEKASEEISRLIVERGGKVEPLAAQDSDLPLRTQS